ncbi:hypothetical protein EB796_004539 [Bugula neritina]|uniref:Uncharacterized protein n=1 Tax=Bugula neritina TaxID=10212 RepID=A0A7J7KGW9_BUGNE|nr:hypothetical protein EB796_004539 [Bugula neritina]
MVDLLSIEFITRYYATADLIGRYHASLPTRARGFKSLGVFLKAFANLSVEESCLFREKLNVNEEPPWQPS